MIKLWTMKNEFEYYQMTGVSPGAGQVAITEIIKARSLEEAIQIAEHEYPKSMGYRWIVREPFTPDVLAKTE